MYADVKSSSANRLDTIKTHAFLINRKVRHFIDMQHMFNVISISSSLMLAQLSKLLFYFYESDSGAKHTRYLSQNWHIRSEFVDKNNVYCIRTKVDNIDKMNNC